MNPLRREVEVTGKGCSNNTTSAILTSVSLLSIARTMQQVTLLSEGLTTSYNIQHVCRATRNAYPLVSLGDKTLKLRGFSISAGKLLEDM